MYTCTGHSPMWSGNLNCHSEHAVCVGFWFVSLPNLFLCLQTLYTYPDSFRAYKVLIAAQYSGAAVKVVCEPPQFELGLTNKSPDFLAKFPLGKVCVFVLGGGGGGGGGILW